MNIDMADWSARAKTVLDPETWAYLQAGADDGISAAGAARAWERIALLPRILRAVGQPTTDCVILGMELASPILTTPNGRATRFHPAGEEAVLAGANAAGVAAILPSSVATSAAALAALHPDALWCQQLYMFGDRGMMADRIAMLHGAGCRAIVLTADLLPGGRAAPAAPAPAAWEETARGIAVPIFAEATFDDLAWICRVSPVPVAVKGVLRADDATACADVGAAAVIVSNHGGNQLDTVISSAAALSHVVAACGDRVEVLVDGGIRRGTSVIKALALGARGVLIGRPTSYALAADGQNGVWQMLQGLASELARAMALSGVRDLADIDRSLLVMS